MQTDIQAIKEFVQLSFGRNYYVDRIKQGRPVPFIGLQGGVHYTNNLTSDNNKLQANATLALGLEVYRGRRLYVSAKTSYFIPLDKEIHKLRGVMPGLNLSYVF